MSKFSAQILGDTVTTLYKAAKLRLIVFYLRFTVIYNFQKRNVPIKSRRIAIVYTHFPHYRAAVFSALSKCLNYKFDFYYDPEGITDNIASGNVKINHHVLKVIKLGDFFWQAGSVQLGFSKDVDGYIFLGNPYILSTWITTIIARLRKKPVLFWTHGWLLHEKGPKAWLRNLFYRLSNGLIVYGTRARDIGIAKGFDSSFIHVIYNSLDYEVQKSVREELLGESVRAKSCHTRPPFFLTVARLVPSVQLEKAIEALAYLTGKVSLVVVGDGPERAALMSLANELGVNVDFRGEIYDEAALAPLFLDACAVVSPGKVGLLAMHALAYGTPVITHDDFDRQMPEVESIILSHAGTFFRYGDVVDLSEKMKCFIDYSSEKRTEIRASAIECIEYLYTPEAQVVRITDALDKVMVRQI